MKVIGSRFNRWVYPFPHVTRIGFWHGKPPHDRIKSKDSALQQAKGIPDSNPTELALRHLPEFKANAPVYLLHDNQTR